MGLCEFYEQVFECALGVVEAAGVLIKKSLLMRAGELAAANNSKNLNVKIKDAPNDLVTEVDHSVQNFIQKELAKKFPDILFVGEEAPLEKHEKKSKNEHDKNKFAWVLDPIDGTTNFVSGFEYFCISLALVNSEREPVLGIVYCPLKNVIYHAVKDKGAFKTVNKSNRQKISVSKCVNKNEAVVGCEWGTFDCAENVELKARTMQNIFSMSGKSCRAIRSVGSAAMNLCLTAEGIFDAYYEWGIHCWDIAAGLLILKEAGGYYTHIEQGQGQNENFDICGRNVVACCTEELYTNLKECLPERLPTLRRDSFF